MLIGVFNLVNIIYLIIINFDGVGVFGVVNVMCSYVEGWINVSFLVFLGDEFVVCVDGVFYVFVLF